MIYPVNNHIGSDVLDNIYTPEIINVCSTNTDTLLNTVTLRHRFAGKYRCIPET